MRMFEILKHSNGDMVTELTSALKLRVAPITAESITISPTAKGTFEFPYEPMLEIFPLERCPQFIAARGLGTEHMKAWVGGIDENRKPFVFQAGFHMLKKFLHDRQAFLAQWNLLELAKPAIIKEIERERNVRAFRFGNLFLVPMVTCRGLKPIEDVTLWPFRITKGRARYATFYGTSDVLIAAGTITGRNGDRPIQISKPHAFAQSEELLFTN